MPQTPADSPPLLIVAVTGRALAASAARARRPVVVLDLFGDRDTRALARSCQVVVTPGALRFDPDTLLVAASTLAPISGEGGLVYGSGFEGQTALLGRLVVGRRLFGNAPEVVDQIRDPKRFFPLLDDIGIPHPEISFLPPATPRGWLLKDPGGAGGAHVRHAEKHPSQEGMYYQRVEPGRTLSVLFLADGRRARVIGVNEQWTSAARPGVPFLFGGAVGGLTLPAAIDEAIRSRLDQLVALTGLVGLNGMDFLLGKEGWSLLEVNPRPTATLELYDPDIPLGLLEAHLRACQGVLAGALPKVPISRALAVVHAPALWEVHDTYSFPEWCRDLPQPGTRCASGDPVCTVHAEAATSGEAFRLVRKRGEELRRSITEDAARAALST